MIAFDVVVLKICINACLVLNRQGKRDEKQNKDNSFRNLYFLLSS